MAEIEFLVLRKMGAGKSLYVLKKQIVKPSGPGHLPA